MASTRNENNSQLLRYKRSCVSEYLFSYKLQTIESINYFYKASVDNSIKTVKKEKLSYFFNSH